MSFGSDNWAGAHPLIAQNLAAHASGFSVPYGDSELDTQIQLRFSEIFERDVAVFFTATGTASNCLALSSVAKPGGFVFAHRESHIIVDECGAPGFFAPHVRLAAVEGKDGRMDVGNLAGEVERVAALDVHGGRPNAVAVTQPTESGTVYSLEHLDQIGAMAKKFGLPFIMDGARFANALVSLGCTPAEMTWKRGVDILSFGGTKNGCWCAEALVFFNPAQAADVPFLRKRAGHLFSKSRFIAAQFEAYLKEDLWLKLAIHANGMAASLADIFGSSKSARLLRIPQANELFVFLDRSRGESLERDGVTCLEWPIPAGVDMGENERLYRFVASFATTDDDIERVHRLFKQ